MVSDILDEEPAREHGAGDCILIGMQVVIGGQVEPPNRFNSNPKVLGMIIFLNINSEKRRLVALSHHPLL